MAGLFLHAKNAPSKTEGAFLQKVSPFGYKPQPSANQLVWLPLFRGTGLFVAGDS